MGGERPVHIPQAGRKRPASWFGVDAQGSTEYKTVPATNDLQNTPKRRRNNPVYQEAWETPGPGFNQSARWEAEGEDEMPGDLSHFDFRCYEMEDLEKTRKRPRIREGTPEPAIAIDTTLDSESEDTSSSSSSSSSPSVDVEALLETMVRQSEEDLAASAAQEKARTAGLPARTVPDETLAGVRNSAARRRSAEHSALTHLPTLDTLLAYGGLRSADAFIDSPVAPPPPQPIDGLTLFSLTTHRWVEPHLKGSALPALCGHALISDENVVWVFGGRMAKEGGLNTEIWQLRVCGDSVKEWIGGKGVPEVAVVQQIAPVLPNGGKRFVPTAVFHSATMVGGDVYTMGGVMQDGRCSSDVYVYNVTSRLWSRAQITGDAPTPRAHHAAAAWHEAGGTTELFIFGGEHTDEHIPGQSTLLNDLYRIQLSGHTKMLSVKITGYGEGVDRALHPPPMSGHTMHVDRGMLYVVGGTQQRGGGGGALEVYVFGLAGCAWRRRRSRFHGAVYDHASCLCGDDVYVLRADGAGAAGAAHPTLTVLPLVPSLAELTALYILESGMPFPRAPVIQEAPAVCEVVQRKRPTRRQKKVVAG